MTILAFHSPKGGAGNTLVTAGIARRSATRGQTITAYDMTRQDSLKLFFGLLPDQKPVRTDGEPMVVRGVRLVGNITTQRERDVAIEQIKTTPADELALVDIASGGLGANPPLCGFEHLRSRTQSHWTCQPHTFGRADPGHRTRRYCYRPQ